MLHRYEAFFEHLNFEHLDDYATQLSVFIVYEAVLVAVQHLVVNCSRLYGLALQDVDRLANCDVARIIFEILHEVYYFAGVFGHIFLDELFLFAAVVTHLAAFHFVKLFTQEVELQLSSAFVWLLTVV